MMRIVSPETIAAEIARARAAGTSVISIDHTLTTKGGVLTRFVKQGHLPATFGFNWDALADAVGDLTDTLVAVGPTPHLPPGVRDTLLAVLDHAAASAGPSLTVVCSPPESTP